MPHPHMLPIVHCKTIHTIINSIVANLTALHPGFLRFCLTRLRMKPRGKCQRTGCAEMFSFCQITQQIPY